MRQRNQARRMSCAAMLALGGLIALPAIAHAGLGAAATVQFAPDVVHVGDSGTGVVTLTNDNSDPNTAATNTVCNIGEACPTSPETVGISVVPACQELAPGTTCAAGAQDPDVYRLGATGTGQAGSACAGTIFDISRVTTDAVDVGRYLFVARPPNGTVVLAGTGAQCRIDITYEVLKMARDANTATPAVETIQFTFHNQKSTFSPILNAAGRGSSANQVILRATPAITTLASPDITLGGTLSDQATVSGLANPQPGSTVTFRLYGPGAGATCAGNPLRTETKPLTLTGGGVGTATSDPYSPSEPGTYRWIARFDGDVNNAPVEGACNEASETRSVAPPPPPPVTAPPPVAPPPPPTVGSQAPVVCTPPPGPAPAGGTLCARGTAAIRGRTGCAGSPFRVTVRGRQIARVVFTLDGRRVRTLTRRNAGAYFALRVDPRRMRVGVHRVIARTTFTSRSGTRARSLRVTFSRCSRRASAPAFTG
jgi:hypothetical protein